jgi:hypothetical protein
MKSKRIIEILKALDPTGETHVSVNGEAIHDFDSLPGYLDGPGVDRRERLYLLET